MSKESC